MINVKYLLSVLVVASLVACTGKKADEMETVPEAEVQEVKEMIEAAESSAEVVVASKPVTLAEIINARSDEDKARDQYRNPQATLEFFQVEPGMTVAEALPGGGWYSKILAAHLGSEGALYGVNYVDTMWPMFGFFSEEAIQGRIAATGKFPEQVAGFTDNGIASQGFTFNTVPEDVAGTVDRVLFVRALHNLNRFEADAGTLSEALAATKTMLKDDGMVGVVQHRLPESHTENTDGSRGYLKQTDVIASFTEAGFELVSESAINANPNDQPTEEEIVWRLPPSLNSSRDNPELMEQMKAIGESDRMTLLFKKAN